MKVWIYSLTSVFLVSLISLIGVFTLSLRQEKLRKILLFFVSFSVGGLFGDAFIHLLPESFEKLGANLATSLYIIAGILIFFILEKFIRWRHCHLPTSEEHMHPVVTLNLIGDGLHNFLDGIIIAGSFLVNINLGIATTIAVIAHEIPQEISDFGVLLHAGFSRVRALVLNLLSASTAILGSIIALIIGGRTESFTNFIIPFTAGNFIYIATSDLFPELKKDCTKLHQAFFQLASIVAGIGIMLALKKLG